ncbi:MAG TPA: hypothetical protein VMJ93_10835 [Verrucomicrobiae bacterium]|nr:hypothetical protein [Verrucomicrobiae bacterium]
MPTGVPATDWVKFLTTSVWTALSDKQRRFFSILVSTGNATVAAREVYGCANSRRVSQTAYQTIRAPRFAKAWRFFRQELPRLVLLDSLKDTAVNATSAVARVEAAALYSKLAGLESSSEALLPVESTPKPKASKSTEKPKHFLNEIVVQDEVEYRVTKLDANGEIENAEEISVRQK